MNKKPTYVTKPSLPPLDEFIESLKEIWDLGIITNNGPFHKKLEDALCEYLGVKYLSLFTNGTIPLMTALQILDIKGEVITTPYSFVATAHSLWWNGIIPVFVDVLSETGNIDPDKIEEAITEKTTAIMPVHVYGNPCDTEKIQNIADKYNLKVVYDAAHAFGVTVNGKSILYAGDISTLSFHATKTYNTVEGGALICHSKEMKEEVDQLKNFGFVNEVTVVLPGINGKMDELRAAYGLLNLKYIDEAIENRKKIVNSYRENLRDVEGIRFLDDLPDVRHNYSYFPIFVDEDEYGMSRDDLYEKLKRNNIFGRRYFYPLITVFNPYNKLYPFQYQNLPTATQLAHSVICLPVYKDLLNETILEVVANIKNRGSS